MLDCSCQLRRTEPAPARHRPHRAVAPARAGRDDAAGRILARARRPGARREGAVPGHLQHARVTGRAVADNRRRTRLVAVRRAADGQPIPIYEKLNSGPFAVQEFPSAARAHGFPDIVDNYAGGATEFPLRNGATLYQIDGGLNGAAGRFEWIVDPKLGGVTHRMFISGGTINGIPIKP